MYTSKIETVKSVRFFTHVPGNSNMVVLHGAYMKAAFLGKGHGLSEHLHALRELAEMGYEHVMCTVAEDNHAQRKILMHAGWISVDQWNSECSGHTVHVYTRSLRDVPPSK